MHGLVPIYMIMIIWLVSNDQNDAKKWQEWMDDKTVLRLTANQCYSGLNVHLASRLSSHCVTLDGAVIILHTHWLSQPPSPCPLHGQHKKCSWLLLLPASVHNDSAACVPLFPCGMSLRNKQLEKVEKKKRKKKKR